MNHQRPMDAPSDEAAAAALQELGKSIEAVWSGIVEAIRPAVDHLQQIGVLLDEAPPADVKDRALWLRRHRGTGPAAVPYAKRRNR